MHVATKLLQAYNVGEEVFSCDPIELGGEQRGGGIWLKSKVNINY